MNLTISQLRSLARLKGHIWSMREDHVEFYALAAMEAAVSGEGDQRVPMHITEGVAHIEITGALMQKVDAEYENARYATQYSTIIKETQNAVAAGAKGIIYHINSPGGTVAGNVEAAEAIAGAGVLTMAVCDGLACSAAYKLAAQTNFITSTISAEVGNIGTIMAWADCTEFWKDMGIEMKALVSEGADLKSTFHLEPNETQLAFLQERIDEAGEQFKESVKEGRGRNNVELDEEVWRAGWYSGAKAESLGLTDMTASPEEAQAYFLDKIITTT